MAGSGHISHSAAGPSRSTMAQLSTPSVTPNTNSTRTSGTIGRPYIRNDSPNTADAMMSIVISPTVLVATLETTRPLTYSPIDSGLVKTFIKFRDHTSSKNAVVTPYITRVRKSHIMTTP